MLYQKPNGINDPLQEKGISFSAAANLVTTQDFTAPTSRGDILGLSVYLGNNTIADVDNSLITISANGVNFYENVPLIKFAALYQNDNNEFDFYAKSGSTITIAVNNTSANAIVTAVNFLFRPPHNR